MRILTGIMFYLMVILTACSAEPTSGLEETNGEGTDMYDHFIAYYEAETMKESLEAALQENIFQKEGFSGGYELAVREATKEIIVTVRLLTEKNYPVFEQHINDTIKAVLEGKYSEYTVKIIPLFNQSNQTTRQYEEERIVNEVVHELKEQLQIDVLPNIHFSETDGRIIRLELLYSANGTELTETELVKETNMEFIRLVEEKGLPLKNIPIIVGLLEGESWKRRFALPVIEGLQNMEELPVSAVTYFNEPGELVIQTSLDPTEEKTKEIGAQIEKALTDFYLYEPVQTSYEAPSQIHLLSLEGQKVNE